MIMKLLLRYRGLNARAIWQGLVETQLKRLQHLAAIASAQVVLERRREARPAFRVHAHLEVPGPDYHAEAIDHTLQAALRKVIKNLERQIHSRRSRRADRWKTNRRLGLLPSHAPTSVAGCRI